MEFLKELGIQSINPGAFANGWLMEKERTLLSSMNPANQKRIAQIVSANSDDYEKVVQTAQETFQRWREVPAPQRGEIIRQIGERLRHHKSALGSLVSMEMGKSKQEGDGEVQEMIDIADFAVGQSRMLYGKTMHSERYRHRMYEQWQPLGVIGVISAFNFPVAVWAWNAFIAAICGNTCIWKPSHKVPLCAIAVQKICDEVLSTHRFSGLFSLFIPENNQLAERFIADENVALISFTGSTHVGRHVGEVVSQRFGKLILELGGNNALIVDETADLSLAIPAIVFGAVGTAGQRCTSLRRLIVHRSLEATLIEKLKHSYQQIQIGDPLDEKNLMGPLIDEHAVEGFEKAIVNIKEQGGEILFGGTVLAKEGFYVQPTMIKAKNDWPIVQQETFAPILYVISYDTLEEAVRLNNAVKQGLSSSLFTTNLKHAEYFLSAVGSDCGIANINIGTSGAEVGGAFGGEKETGGGRESGSDAWQAYMRRQTNTINWSDQLPLAQGIKFL